MFVSRANMYEGERARLYRSPMEISRDINYIKEKIDEVNRRLNNRQVLGELFTELTHGDPEDWVLALSRIASEAEESLDDLRKLKVSLDGLSEEMEDTLWALGR